MAGRELRHEHYIGLKIRLDRLTALEDRCRDALSRLIAGGISRDDYMVLLDQQLNAQREWVQQHQKVFAKSDA